MKHILSYLYSKSVISEPKKRKKFVAFLILRTKKSTLVWGYKFYSNKINTFEVSKYFEQQAVTEDGDVIVKLRVEQPLTSRLIWLPLAR